MRVIWLAFFTLLGCTFVTAEPTNLQLYKQQLIQYHDSGDYDREFAASIHKAMVDLTHEVKTARAAKLAIVLDIDETALSNYSWMRSDDFGGPFSLIEQEIHKANDPALKPTLELYRYAKQHQVAVFFVTGRREHERALTQQNLEKMGYQHWDGLFLKPENYRETSVVPFKSSIRKSIEQKGYRIIENIGDQLSDLAGGYSLHTYKLPDPFYYIP